MPRWLLGIPGNEPIPASEDVGRVTDSAELRTWTYAHELTIVRDDGRVFVWNPTSVAVDDGSEDSLAVAINNGGIGRYEFVGASLALSTPAGIVPASTVDTTQAGAGGRLAVNALGQQYPRQSEFDKLINGLHANIADPALRAITDGIVYALRQQDRYVDTGQVRSRSWNDDAKYLIIGEAGDACEQIWWAGNKGVKTAAGATSCLRIPNADIDPDAAFAVTFLVASIPGNAVANRPLVMVGSQHGTKVQARALLAQGTDEDYCLHNAQNSASSLAGICPYVITMSAASGAGGNVSFYRDGAHHTTQPKIAGTVYADDHVIGGYWDESGGVWVSYAGFYVFSVIVHNRALTTIEVLELHRSILDPTKVPAVISIGQSNNDKVAGATPDAPPLPDYRSAQNETGWDGMGLGWGPIAKSPYYGAPAGGVNDAVSVTQGIAQHFPGHVCFKVTRGGHQLLSFYDWSALDFLAIYEPLLRSVWQLGQCVDLRQIFIVSCESEADATVSPSTVSARLSACSARYRRGFQQSVSLQSAIRVNVARLNSQYALVRPVGTPLVQSGMSIFVATDPNARLLDTDPWALEPDNTHQSANHRILIGSALGVMSLAGSWVNPPAPVIPGAGIRALVTNFGGASVSPLDFDGVLWTASAAVGVGTQPIGVAITADGLRALVVNYGSNNVTPLAWNGSAWAAGAPVSVGNGPRYVAITPDGLRALVTNATAGTITPLAWNGATWVAGAPIAAGTQPYGVAITSDGLHALVANYGSANVTPLDWDGATWVPGAPIAAGTSPFQVAISTGRAIVTNYGSANITQLVWGGVTWSAGAPVTVDANPIGVGITSDGLRAIVVSSNTAGLTELNWSGGVWVPVAPTTSVGSTSYGAGLSADDLFGLVVHSGGNDVSPISWSGSAWTVSADVAVGASPLSVAITIP